MLVIATLLDLHGIAVRSGHNCAQPLMQRYGLETVTRASLSLYNTEGEVEKFGRALKEVVAKLKQ